ncbi:uncharacterized protein LOC129974920 isoform X1 [Argiope bruennichi]|uniref:uncharacterized protein LOC129974920 isoform X1 n=1 Tax=Argiope bruennichi TaxID=94029 RepID=UPI00249595C4|nr:uncharacterized protein LOC129974920 isoform X1 [Argiope bruennichi]
MDSLRCAKNGYLNTVLKCPFWTLLQLLDLISYLGYKCTGKMNYHNVIGVLPLFLFIGSYALDYGILENMEMTCLPRDNCMLARRASFINRSCECDNECHSFRDCCIDKATLAPLVPRRTVKQSCMTYGGQFKVGVYVVDTCPQDYRASTNVRNLCQEGDESIDPIVAAPVTFVSTGTTFKNRYCAECNGVSASSLVTWLIYLNCETLVPLQINDSYIWQNVKYNLSLKTWGVKLEDEFHKCELIYDKPNYLTAVRLCRANTIDSCPPSFLRVRVKRLCESYSAVMYDVDNSYKNPHCAICNNKTLNSLTCLDSSLFIRNANKPFSFALLLDINQRDGDQVGTVQRCPAGEKYDPFFKKCRALVCALPGYKIVNGICKK